MLRSRTPRACLPAGLLAVAAAAVCQPLQSSLRENTGRNGWQHIVVHHSASASGNAAVFARLHRSKGWDDVGYHFVITNGRGAADGDLEVTSRWWLQKHGAHAGRLRGPRRAAERNRYNEFGIGICLVGNFENSSPTNRQMETARALIGRLRGLFDIPPDEIFGHRHVISTACPGDRFPWRKMAAGLNLRASEPTRQRAPTPTTERCHWCAGREFAAARGGGNERSDRGRAPDLALLELIVAPNFGGAYHGIAGKPGEGD